MRALPILWTLLLAAAPALLLVRPAPAIAQSFENLDRIDSIVATTVGAGIGQPGGALSPVDRRLRLAACPQIPTVEGPVFGAAVVRCDRIGWRIRVPLMAVPTAAAQARPAQRMMLVKKGDPVLLVAGDATFTVSKAMIADEDGAIGDMIRVREDRNATPVTGRVEPNGIIRVPGI